MNDLKENNQKKALASAAFAHGITPQRFEKDAYFPIDRYGERVAGTRCYDYWTTPGAALTAAAEALGLEPDHTLQQQEQTPLSPPVHMAVHGQNGEVITIHVTEDAEGLRLRASGDGESAAELLRVAGDVREQTPASMVMVPVVDVRVAASFLALFRGKEPSQVYDMADGARERLEELITTFTALAPKESTSTSEGRPE